VPELEAWERVYIANSNGSTAAFMTSVHGPDYEGSAIEHALTCQMCHNGPADNTFADMTEAHEGVILDPSAPNGGQVGCLQCHDSEFGETACDNCHESIAAANANSLHTNLWGEKAAIELRCECDFEGASWSDMYDNKCGGCHTTCGQCHVSRPNSVGGGFPKFGGIVYSAHGFNRTPDMTENCTACHGSRIGTDFNGDLEGVSRDVHRNNGMKCEGCHTGTELHGDGQHEGDHYTHRYQVATMPRCETCHDADIQVDTGTGCTRCHINGVGEDPVEVPAELVNHAHHIADNSSCSHCHRDGVPSMTPANLQCQVCHSQPYKNCTNCHNLVADEEPNKYDIDPSVVQFKIAQNPSPHRPEYDYVVVRHVPVDPGTYDDWGLTLPGYLDEPTWKYTSPHNILRITPQTTVADGATCATACHGTPDSPEGWFLRESDLYDGSGSRLPDYEANIGIVLPDPDVAPVNEN